MSIDIKLNNTNSILIVIRMRFFIKDIGNCLCSEIHSKLILDPRVDLWTLFTCVQVSLLSQFPTKQLTDPGKK